MKKSIKNPASIPGIEKEIKIKKSEKIDSANLQGIKKDASGNPERSGNLYLNFASLSAKDQKKERSKLRRKLESFRNSILGKDRKEEERKESLKEFISYYRNHWRIQDFKFENFSHQKDEDFKKDWESILNLAKKSLEKK